MPAQFTSWSPSRLADYDQCPRMAKLKHLDKLCPNCFGGRLMGGFDTPEVCDTCGEENVKAEPLERGGAIGKRLEDFVNGKAKTLKTTYTCEGEEKDVEIRHPKVIELAKELRTDAKKKKVLVELPIALDRNWNVVKDPRRQYREVWLRTKLDVFRHVTKSSCRVIDWKTGGIDKRTGQVRDDDKYGDQLQSYCVAALCAFPTMQSTSSALVFVDCGPRFDPTIERPEGYLSREDLPKVQKAMEKRVKPMMSDTSFAPKPNGRCSWCPFGKSAGGPCQF